MSNSPAPATPLAENAEVPRVVVCVVTFQRPDGLRRLLERLGQLTFAVARPRLDIQIVDNDPLGSGGPVCRHLPPRFPWPVHYAVEGRRGIAVARNRALVLAKDRADFIVFIDDDEVPQTDWLDQLLAAQRKSGAPVVTGPVLPHYGAGAPGWVVKGRFHERTRLADGDVLPFAATGNVLLSKRVLDQMDAFFDERLALSGGEDKEFFRRVRRAGFPIVWADRAVAYEEIPAFRTTARWILQRAFRYGNTGTIMLRNEGASLPTRGAQFAVGCYRIAKGFLLLPLSLVVGRHAVVRCARHVAYGMGILSGFSGRLYAEYGGPRSGGRRGAS